MLAFLFGWYVFFMPEYKALRVQGPHVSYALLYPSPFSKTFQCTVGAQ